MKFLITAFFVLSAITSSATPYFRTPFTPGEKIHKLSGAAINPTELKETSFVTEVALITHSTKDGCVMPSIVCEDWTPLAIGPSYNAGKFQVIFGPIVNLAPATKNLLKSGLDMITSPDSLTGIKSMLSDNTGDITISFGPQTLINPISHGVFMPINKWTPTERIFAGSELRF